MLFKMQLAPLQCGGEMASETSRHDAKCAQIWIKDLRPLPPAPHRPSVYERMELREFYA